MSEPDKLHGTALVIDMRHVLESAQLAQAEGEGEEEEDRRGGTDDDERDFGHEPRPNHGRPDRHASVAVGHVETALRDGATEELTRPLQAFDSGNIHSAFREERGPEAACVTAIGPGWLATGYMDGSVRVQQLPSHLSWAHQPGTSACALHDGASFRDRCGWTLPDYDDDESDDGY